VIPMVIVAVLAVTIAALLAAAVLMLVMTAGLVLYVLDWSADSGERTDTLIAEGGHGETIGRACAFSGAVAVVTLAGVKVFAPMTGWASALAQTEQRLATAIADRDQRINEDPTAEDRGGLHATVVGRLVQRLVLTDEQAQAVAATLLARPRGLDARALPGPGRAAVTGRAAHRSPRLMKRLARRAWLPPAKTPPVKRRWTPWYLTPLLVTALLATSAWAANQPKRGVGRDLP
jgi:hypothetical protein